MTRIAGPFVEPPPPADPLWRRVMRPRGEPPGAGYALIEILAALVVTSLVVAIAMPHVQGLLAASELERAATEVAAILRIDRNAAMERGREVFATVDLAKRVVVSGASDRSIEIPDGVTIEIKRAGGAAATAGTGFAFRPDGRSSGGFIRLRRDGRSHTITVNWLNSAIVGTSGRAGRAVSPGNGDRS
jgi:general secretion pathway protein H